MNSFESTLSLAQALIACESVTPNDAGCQSMIVTRLADIGFVNEQLDFAETKNCWLRRGVENPLFVFLGHTDVVPSGALDLWHSPPFEPTLRYGQLYGRGAADMKGAIACFVTAVERFIIQHPYHKGSIALLLTSDEEGLATHGIVKVVDVLEKRGDKIDWCLVGEPSSNEEIGDMIRVGRRGSLCANLTVHGVQGHVAYPDLADNPIHRLVPALDALVNEVWDRGNEFFPPTRLQISNIHSGTGAENVIPASVNVQFNLRFSTELTAELIKERVESILNHYHLKYELEWRLSGNPFLTTEGDLIDAVHEAVEEVAGFLPSNDTGGGTSDGRFIAPTGAQVVELGALNASIHKVNEHIGVSDLEVLSRIYEQILVNLLINR
jgi:succinyl-diaminopimelate desuccinylase